MNVEFTDIKLTAESVVKFRKQKQDLYEQLPDGRAPIFYGNYGTFAADYCRSTGLPMFEKHNIGEVVDRYLTITRMGGKLEPTDEIVGWYRVRHGFVPLFHAK